MANQKTIVWTPFQRNSVIDFLKLYTSKLEESKDDPNSDYGLADIQSGILHLADKVLPSGVAYTVNQGPNAPIHDDVRIILTDEDLQEFEDAHSKEAA